VALEIFRQGADTSDEGDKIPITGYCKWEKSPKKYFLPSDGETSVFRRGAIAP